MSAVTAEFLWWQRWLVRASALVPHQLLGSIVYHASRWRWQPWKNFLIRVVVRRYQVDLGEAVIGTPEGYGSFAEFFTRELAPGQRPLPTGPNVLVSPVDARVSQAGNISQGLLLQAKGLAYSVEALLGGDSALAERFGGGHYLTLYLSPRDYHRVHMPLAGRLRGMTYVPGRMFSVNDASTAMIPGLFTRNERVVAWFDSVVGPVALVLVGAMCVSAIETSWFGRVTVDRRSGLCRWSYPTEGDEVIALARGEEMGRFGLGSTVILLLPPGGYQPAVEVGVGDPVRMGQSLGALVPEGLS